jgi:exopolysaccharide biosynthesis polyprenyl glycosylphosphotransferase
MTVIKPRIPFLGGRTPLTRRLPFGTGPSGAPRTTGSVSSERTWARHYRARLRFTDTTVILVSITAAFLARFGFDAPVAHIDGQSASYWSISVVIAAAWLSALSVAHTRDSRVVGMGVTEYKRVVNSSALTFGLLAIAFVVGNVDIARGYFVLALPIGVVGLLGSRWLWRKWLIKQRMFDHYLSRALVVGGLDDVQYVVKQIRQKSGAAYNVVGAAVENAETNRVSVGNTEQVPIVADLVGVAAAASRLGVDTVIVAGQPHGGSQFIRNLGWELEGTATELVLASRLTDVAGPRIHFRPVEGLPLIHVEIPQFEGGKHVLKRALDAAASGIALVVLLPLLIAIGIAIKLDSPGPILFRQDRVGRNGATFRMFKFRSMVQTAEQDLASLQSLNEASGLLFKIRHDPRVTRAGRVLRKYSLDELPQLWNVFIGDMSLVGPRPPLRREVQGYENYVHRRLYIKPGLTGMWQVNGRSDLSWEESVRLDLYYVENWSLTGDLVIMWRTFKVLTHPVGAY